MISYLDKTFCSAPCKRDTCHRHWTDELQEAARNWLGDDGAPVAFSDFSKTCQDYDPR